MVTSIVVFIGLSLCLAGSWLGGPIMPRLRPLTAAALFARLGHVLLVRLDRPARGERVLRVRGVLMAFLPLFPALAVYGLLLILRATALSPFAWLFDGLLFVWACPPWRAPWQPGMEGALGGNDITAFLSGPAAAVFAYVLGGVGGLVFLRALLSFYQVAEHADPPPSHAFRQTPERLSLALLILPDILSAVLIVLAAGIAGVPRGAAGFRPGALIAGVFRASGPPGALTRRLAAALPDRAACHSVAMIAHLILLALAALAVMAIYV